ncbi:endonuclease/exonuclease/phosphatase family protein [Streptomyces sp. MP131-18]|uniref:endonuclease/exonuclease/phosphatase family protein n=1 Tax=Streptomyces sp. MP131-18 TaxID=1857892 RepID=UPI00097C4E00|nr:endonuclease/exonuclease/phosphatase family protein [Streptomyces sp. MP131-18]ONK10316.1 mRNA deadenylase, exonuclease subunit [Streptomyces sp. MP131-18]
MRFLTWNVWWRFGSWERRKEAILAVLRAERPDVCGLQEVWDAEGTNLAGWLAGELGMHWAWGPGEVFPHWPDRPGGVRAGVGNAVLSRWPVIRSETRRLPVAGGPDEVRVALFALVDAPGARVPFFTTHLHSAPGGSAVRCAQARALAGFVAERSGEGSFPPVVTGDFNAAPDSAELRCFHDASAAGAEPGAELADVWRAAPAGAAWATWDPANPLVAGPAKVRARIDYIHTGPPDRGGGGAVLSARRAGDAPVAGVWPSDHAAVIAELAAPAAPAAPD